MEQKQIEIKVDISNLLKSLILEVTEIPTIQVIFHKTIQTLQLQGEVELALKTKNYIPSDLMEC